MAGELKWDDTKLKAGLQTAERNCVKLCAAHWARAAQQKVSVSAGGAGKRARKIRATKGAIVGILASEYAKRRREGYTPRGARENVAQLYDTYRHSKPGEPPRKITGFGQRNIVSKMADTARPIARAGLFLNALYMYFLDQGFVIRRRGSKSKRGGTRVAPRPWMDKTTVEQQPAFRSIVERLGVDSTINPLRTTKGMR